MVKLSNGMYVIGFDNGYQFGKTSGFIFDNGNMQQKGRFCCIFDAAIGWQAGKQSCYQNSTVMRRNLIREGKRN